VKTMKIIVFPRGYRPMVATIGRCTAEFRKLGLGWTAEDTIKMRELEKQATVALVPCGEDGKPKGPNGLFHVIIPEAHQDRYKLGSRFLTWETSWQMGLCCKLTPNKRRLRAS